MRIDSAVFQFRNEDVRAEVRGEKYAMDARQPSVVLDNIKVVYPLSMDCLTA